MALSTRLDRLHCSMDVTRPEQAETVESPVARVGLLLRMAAIWGPGLVVMLADTDAGNVVTAAQAGAQWEYRLLPLLCLLIPLLYMLQELTVRLGIFTGRGHGDLIRDYFGPTWAWISVGGLGVATVGSLITEFTAVAGVGELYGMPRAVTLPVAAAFLLAVVLTGSYRRTERVALIIGLFECAFFGVAWSAFRHHDAIAREAFDLPLHNAAFLYLAAAVIGAVFNPWMIFYQQSAVVDKQLTPKDLTVARWDVALGAILTQLLTGAVLVAVAVTMGGHDASSGLQSIGEISDSLVPTLGHATGRWVFSAGVLGAALVAAVVCSLALAWGVGEVAGYRRSLEDHPLQARWFYGVYALCLIAAAILVWFVPDLIWLNITAQVVNVFLLPMVVGFLVMLSVRALPEERKPRGWYLAALVSVSTAVCVFGLIGGLSGIF